jgi:DNA invertase Pin-like site-specific DNA recombinase
MVLGGEHLSVDGYVRVSQVGGRRGERFISPDVQRDVIERWAAMRGAQILDVFDELDESGGRGDRPVLETVPRRVESGISDGIVVAKVDRFGRSLISGLAAIERIKVAGGTFVSVQDGLDTSTESGRLVLRILLSLGEWESERIGAAWEQAHARAVARGVYNGRGAPLGYRKTRAGRLSPDPRTAGLVAQAFRRRADGDSGAAIGRWLEAQGARTRDGNTGWTTNSVGRLLRNRVYLGELRYGAHLNDHAHPALVDGATWEAAQRPRRSVGKHRRDRPLLAQLVRCAGCSLVMTARWHPRKNEARLAYVCQRNSAAGRCPAPASTARRTSRPTSRSASSSSSVAAAHSPRASLHAPSARSSRRRLRSRGIATATGSSAPWANASTSPAWRHAASGFARRGCSSRASRHAVHLHPAAAR